MNNIGEFKRKIEETGENKVRERLASGIYGPKKTPIVKEWLAYREKERNDVKYQETLLIAKSAKRAAWVAAVVAIISALVTVIAILANKQ